MGALLISANFRVCLSQLTTDLARIPSLVLIRINCSLGIFRGVTRVARSCRSAALFPTLSLGGGIIAAIMAATLAAAILLLIVRLIRQATA
jgi:hypothetical protein